MFLVNLRVWLVIISTFKDMIIFVALVAFVVSDWMDVLEPLPHFHFYNFPQGLGSALLRRPRPSSASLVLGLPREALAALLETFFGSDDEALMWTRHCSRLTCLAVRLIHSEELDLSISVCVDNCCISSRNHKIPKLNKSLPCTRMDDGKERRKEGREEGCTKTGTVTLPDVHKVKPWKSVGPVGHAAAEST